MCGIALVCSTSEQNFSADSNGRCHDAASQGLLAALRARGPDFIGDNKVEVKDAICCLTFIASLLQLRGTLPRQSPCVSEDGSILCFNGEVFGGLDVRAGENDGAVLLDALTASPGSEAAGGAPQVLSRLRGPWAILFWEPARQRLWLGRDVMGRRSLLAHFPDPADPRLIFSSVSELPTAGDVSASPTHGSAAAAPATAGSRAAADGARDDAAAPDGEAHGEAPEPSGYDGYWTELPPGMYSISFAAAQPQPPLEGKPPGIGPGQCADGPATAPPPPPPVDGPHSRPAVLVDGARDQQPSRAELYRQFCLHDGVELRMHRHDWRDPLLRQLAAYRRAESGAAAAAAAGAAAAAEGGRAAAADAVSAELPPAGVESAVAGSACACKEAAAEEQARAAPATGAAAVVAPVAPSGPGGTASGLAAAADGLSPGSVGIWLAHPLEGRLPAVDPGEALAQALLSALLAAVRVRCACIETRSPHPSALYAATLNARAAARNADAAAAVTVPRPLQPQPTWRRDDPHDCSLPVLTDGLPTDHHSSGGGGGASARPPAAPLMILFSGGVDSVLLAALAHKVMPLDVPIDLSNVCFAGPGAAPSPDREAARDALEELAAACPGRCWRLVEADAALEDVDRHRSRILALLRPASTVMDLNIGAALWLAAAGQGTLRLPAHANSAADAAGALYGSAARVVLLGHGADEQCGGYGRHRTRFRAAGWSGLSEELEVDVRRLWLRNLGRDDRLVADWGREGRHPFLDEQVMDVLLRARLDCLVDLQLPPGQGDKRVLRTALQLLGLPRAAARVKRAIQFGSRIGKASNRRDFGSNRAANRRNAGGVALQDVAAVAASAAGAAWVKPPAPVN